MIPRAEFTPNISESDFSSYGEPELSLVRLRREFEARLRWLDVRLAPDHAGKADSAPGQILVERGIIDPKFYGAIRDLLTAADPTQNTGGVSRSDSAVLIETGLSLIRNLDSLIEVTNSRSHGLSPNAKLVYAFLELPATRRMAIAKDLGLIEQSDLNLTNTELGKLTFRRASGHTQLEQLWDLVAREASVLSGIENPFKGK